jgi:hypothetical protein
LLISYLLKNFINENKKWGGGERTAKPATPKKFLEEGGEIPIKL